MKKSFIKLTLLFALFFYGFSVLSQSGRVGIGESSPGSKGSIKGNLSVGSTYSSLPAPADGAIIEGKTGIGNNNPDEKLDVVGNVKASDKVIGTRGFVAGNVSSDTGRAVFSTDITNKGFYIPRLTTAQKTTLGGTLGVVNKGLLVYDIEVNRMEYWDGVQWKAVGDSITKVFANNGLTKSGDTIQLGGALIKNTTVNQSTFNMLFSGTGVFGVGATDARSKLNVSPGTINNGIRIGDFPAASSGKTGLAIDMVNTSTSNGIDITNIGATAMQGIRINSTANGNGTGIRIGDATTLGTGINIRGGTGIVYNALSAASGTGITIGGTTAPLNGVDAIVSGAGTGGIFQSSTAGAGVFGLSISGSYSRPSLLPLAGVRGYTATNSNSSAEVAYAVHGASTRYTAAGGTGTTTYGLFGSATGNATSAGNGLMVGTYGTASVTNVGTSGAIGGLFNAASGSTNLALAASGGGDVYLGSSDADRPSNFTTGALSLGTGNTNTTRMFNTRISGTQTFVGSTSGTVGIRAPATITSYSVTLPNAQGAANTVLRNDGSGNLTWATGGSLLTAGTGISISGSTISNTGAVTASNGLTLVGTDVRLGGALTAATTVSGLTGTNKMSFTGTGVDAFNVDGATFSVDATNDRVGVGTASPAQRLDVSGGNAIVRGASWATSGDQAYLYLGDTNQKIFSEFGQGVFIEPFLTTKPFFVEQVTGNVGIGNTNPGYILDVSDRIRLRSGGGGSSSAGVWYNNTDNTALLAFTGTRDANNWGIYGVGINDWHFNFNRLSGNVGIGLIPSTVVGHPKLAVSRDGVAACCGGEDATIGIGESTSSTGRRASISFHNSDEAEGKMQLIQNAINGVSSRRIQLFDHQNQGLGLEMSGRLWYGPSGSRTENRDNAGLKGNDGAQSGFFETYNPSNFPSGATSWWHLIDSRHSNTSNNYAMQFAGSFYDQRLFFRKTNNDPAQAWSEIPTVGNNSFWSMSANIAHSPDDITSYTDLVFDGEDDVTRVYNLGFNVVIDGVTYNQISVCSNGWIAFGNIGATNHSNTALPATFTTNPVIFPYWDDLRDYGGGEYIRALTVGTSPNRTACIYFRMRELNTTVRVVHFQVQIHETSNLINVKYFDPMGHEMNGQSATIGFQLGGGSSAKSYPITFNGKVLDDNRVDAEGWSVSPIR